MFWEERRQNVNLFLQSLGQLAGWWAFFLTEKTHTTIFTKRNSDILIDSCRL